METNYNILEIPITASQQEIREAYLKMSVKYHPSKNPDYNDKFIKISKAFENLYKDGYVLSNDDLFGANINKNEDEYLKKNLRETECKIQ